MNQAAEIPSQYVIQDNAPIDSGAVKTHFFCLASRAHKGGLQGQFQAGCNISYTGAAQTRKPVR